MTSTLMYTVADFFGIVGRNGSGKSIIEDYLGHFMAPGWWSVEVNGTLVPFIELELGLILS